MAGKTGYTAPTNSTAPLGPAQMTTIYEHFDGLTNQAVATAGSLPASGNWTGREISTTDTLITYRWYGSWVAWDSPWITYTPTLTGVTVGTGGSAASVHKYRFRSGQVLLSGRITLGTSGGAVSGIPTYSLPRTHAPLKHAYEPLRGQALCVDVSTGFGWFVGAMADNTSTTAGRLVPAASGAISTAISATVPFTWAAGDSLSWELEYDPA